jgi:outer membrane PBP1 activator LpoA protein
MICSRAPFSLPALLLWLLAAIGLTACGPVERAPIATPERAAALAERGDHAAAANEYESLAASTPGGDANTWRLSAIEQWLLADRVEPAANGLALLAAPLDVSQTFERDRLNVLLIWRRDGAANAWQNMTALTTPDAANQRAARARFFELRQRLALANALPVESVRSALEREKLSLDPTVTTALRNALLADLRAAVDTGLRIDPRLAGRDALVRGWLEAASLAARAARVPASGNGAITAAWQRRYPNHPARTALVATHLDAPQPLAPASMPMDAPRSDASRSVAAETTAARSGAISQVDSAHIAVLLPLSGRLASAGRAVRDGLIAAQFAHGVDAPALRFYDTATATDAATMQSLIARASAAGARLQIGPLSRDEVILAANLPNSLPQLLLNTLPAPAEDTPSSVASPWSNGHAERGIRTIKEGLRKFLMQEQSMTQWDRHLSLFVQAHNQSVSVYGYAPESLMFGYQKPRPNDLLEIWPKAADPQQYMDNILEKAETQRKITSDRRKAASEKNRTFKNQANVFDEDYISTVGSGGFSNSDPNGTGQTLLPGAPRQVFFTLKAAF